MSRNEYAGLMTRSWLVMISFVVAMMYRQAYSPQPTFSTEEWTSSSIIHEVKVNVVLSVEKTPRAFEEDIFQRDWHVI